MMRIGIDIDGVLYDWEATARYLLEWRWGYKDLPVSTEWDSIQKSIEKKHWQWLWTAGVEKYGLFRHGNCIKGAFNSLCTLAAEAELVLITSRPHTATADTLAWVAFHEIPTHEVHIIGPRADKTQIACDWYLDDKPSNVRAYLEKGRRALLWDQPWNQEAEDLAVVRVRSWAEVEAAIGQAARGETDAEEAVQQVRPTAQTGERVRHG